MTHNKYVKKTLNVTVKKKKGEKKSFPSQFLSSQVEKFTLNQKFPQQWAKIPKREGRKRTRTKETNIVYVGLKYICMK